MKKSSRHSRGKAIAFYFCVTIVGAAAVSTGVAVGVLINAHSFMHLPVNASNRNAIASNQSTYAFSDIASSDRR
jgi:hypothetical protein